jgi:hypothetical protein
MSKPFPCQIRQLLQKGFLSLDEYLLMIREDRPLDQFLFEMGRSGGEKEKKVNRTDRHRELIVWENDGHVIKEVLVIFVQLDRFQRYARKERL